MVRLSKPRDHFAGDLLVWPGTDKTTWTEPCMTRGTEKEKVLSTG